MLSRGSVLGMEPVFEDLTLAKKLVTFAKSSLKYVIKARTLSASNVFLHEQLDVVYKVTGKFL